jgi:hypothetical protein
MMIKIVIIVTVITINISDMCYRVYGKYYYVC